MKAILQEVFGPFAANFTFHNILGVIILLGDWVLLIYTVSVLYRHLIPSRRSVTLQDGVNPWKAIVPNYAAIGAAVIVVFVSLMGDTKMGDTRLFSVNGFFHTVKSDEWLSFYTGVCAAFLIYYLEYGKSYALIPVAIFATSVVMIPALSENWLDPAVANGTLGKIAGLGIGLACANEFTRLRMSFAENRTKREVVQIFGENSQQRMVVEEQLALIKNMSCTASDKVAYMKRLTSSVQRGAGARNLVSVQPTRILRSLDTHLLENRK